MTTREVERPAQGRTKLDRTRNRWLDLWALRVGLVAAALAMWQFLPKVHWLSERFTFFDPFFVSSPSLVSGRLVDLLFGTGGQPTVWAALLETLKGTLIGVIIGLALGAVVGLIFSNNDFIAKALNPFVVMLNAVPRIALIPIIVIIFGPSLTASVTTTALIVFFLSFYNAFAGGKDVAQQMLDNARLLGASPTEQMLQIRAKYVLVWTAASVPNAISFGLLASVTTEILSGQPGVGQLLNQSIANADATLTFSVVVLLSAVGVILVAISEYFTNRALHWWKGASS